MDEALAGLVEQLADAIAAVSPDRSPTVLRNAISDPTALFSWHELHSVLRRAELDWVHPHVENGRPRHRLVLFRSGRMVDPSRLFREETTPRGTRTHRMDPAALAAELRSGGTFVVRDLDREVESVASVAEALEQQFVAPVMGGAFASWGSGTGFDLHWDPMDNVAVQVAGSRRWSLWAPAMPCPVEGDQMPQPTGPPDVDVVLQPGDALLFRRGWWHRPEGTGRPALHLTLGIYRPTGFDLVRWLVRDSTVVAGELRLGTDLDQPWAADVADAFLEARRRSGVANRLTFTLPGVDAEPERLSAR